MSQLKGKVSLITGGSQGIGLAIARRLAAEGSAVVLAARTEKRLQDAVASLQKEGLAARGVAADVSREGDVGRLLAETMKEHGRIDILVNNAGTGVFRPVAEMETADFDLMWGTNLRGPFLLTHGVLPLMKHGGEIVFINSLAGKNSFVGGAGYSATKWGLRAFASSLMLEVRDRNIRVISIFPGSVDTAFSPTKKSGVTQPEDVADAVLFAVTAPGRSMFSEIDVRPTHPPAR